MKLTVANHASNSRLPKFVIPLVALGLCAGTFSALGQSDPTTGQPVLREPSSIIPSLRGGGGVTLRAIYDDRVHNVSLKNSDGTRSFRKEMTVTHSYNRKFPGETLRVFPGETLRVTLHNDLHYKNYQVALTRPRVIGNDDTQEVKDFIKSKKNITNLHTHGLHVSPGGYSDNVLLHINQGKKVDYVFNLPSFHAPGTHWYHSHVHGSTGLQVTRGMLGVLIVNEPIGQNLTPTAYLSRTKERLLVLRQESGAGINPNAGQPLEPKLAALLSEHVAANKSELPADVKQLIDVDNEQEFRKMLQNLRSKGQFKSLISSLENLKPEPVFTINGQINPVDEILPGDIIRLRILNAGANVADFKEIYIENHDMYLAAFDGVNLTKLPRNASGGYIAYNKANPLPLAPANRADVYFIAEGSGRHGLIAKPADGSQIGGNDPVDGRAFNDPQPMMTFEISRPDFADQEGITDADHQISLQTFLEELDKNLQRLQGIGAYAKGKYLHQFDMNKEPDVKRTLVYNVDTTPNPRVFSINDRDYNELNSMGMMKGMNDYLGKHVGDGGKGPNGESPWPIRLGTVEEWKIVNKTSHNRDTRHPFHIHVNPFWVYDIGEAVKNEAGVYEVHSVREKNPNDPRLNRWQDTVTLPGNGGYVVVRHRFENFTGLYVNHCHILNHEDRGMMMNILIVPNQETDPHAFFEARVTENERLNDQINN